MKAMVVRVKAAVVVTQIFGGDDERVSAAMMRVLQQR
jgi:hypothetical protein